MIAARSRESGSQEPVASVHGGVDVVVDGAPFTCDELPGHRPVPALSLVAKSDAADM